MKRIVYCFILLFVTVYAFADVPGLVSSIQIPSPITNAQFNISWAAPSTGGVVTRYEVQREAAGQGWQVPGGTFNGLNFSNIDSLQTNLYRFQVRACNDEGCAPFTTTAQIQAAGPVVVSGETNCEPDGYCVRLRGSNLATSQTYVAIRELNN